jgi:hypothetical protein
MFSVILYMLRQTVDNRAPPLPFPSFSPLTVTFPKLSVILRTLYWVLMGKPEGRRPLGRPREDGITVNLREIGSGCRADPVGSG